MPLTNTDHLLILIIVILSLGFVYIAGAISWWAQRIIDAARATDGTQDN